VPIIPMAIASPNLQLNSTPSSPSVSLVNASSMTSNITVSHVAHRSIDS
jgi:hypothetical protein